MSKYRLSTKIGSVFIFLFFIVIQNQNIYAQQDSTNNPELLREDMARKRQAKKAARRKRFLATLPKNHNPKAASLLALIPGMGQIYNRRYWKLPIVYAGFGVFGYFTITNYIDYGCYRKAYLHLVDSDPTTNYVCPSDPNATEGSLKIYRDNARESAEFFVLGLTVFYGLTIIDAFVDAHLMGFDISDDLSMSIRPTIDYDIGMPSVVAGVGLSIQSRITKKRKLFISF